MKTNLKFAFLAFVAKGFLLQIALASGVGPVDRFLSAPNYKRTEGSLLLRDNKVGWPKDAFERLLWSNGDFVQEVALASPSAKFGERSTILYAEGRYRGTNWSYRDAVLTTQGSQSAESQTLQSHLGGLSPEEHFLSTILGRGFALSDLSSLRKTGEYSAEGKYGGIIPIRVSITSSNGYTSASFDFARAGRTNFYVFRFSLTPFDEVTFVPRDLVADARVHGKTTEELNVTVLFATNSLGDEVLSPWKRYPVLGQRLREGENLYALDAASQTRHLIPRQQARPGFSGWKRWTIPTCGFLVLLFPVAVYFSSLRKHLHDDDRPTGREP